MAHLDAVNIECASKLQCLLHYTHWLRCDVVDGKTVSLVVGLISMTEDIHFFRIKETRVYGNIGETKENTDAAQSSHITSLLMHNVTL